MRHIFNIFIELTNFRQSLRPFKWLEVCNTNSSLPILDMLGRLFFFYNNQVLVVLIRQFQCNLLFFIVVKSRNHSVIILTYYVPSVSFILYCLPKRLKFVIPLKFLFPQAFPCLLHLFSQLNIYFLDLIYCCLKLSNLKIQLPLSFPRVFLDQKFVFSITITKQMRGFVALGLQGL